MRRRSSPPERRTSADALVRRKVFTDLKGWLAWCQTQGIKPAITEMAIPWDYAPQVQTNRWKDLHDHYLRLCDAAGCWVVMWAVGDWGAASTADWLEAFRGDGGSISEQRPNAETMLRRHRGLARSWRGFNNQDSEASGPLEGSTTGTLYSDAYACSAHSPRVSFPGHPVINTCYRFDSTASLAYLHRQGVDLYRLPIWWERMQPTLNGALDATKMAEVKAAILDINNAGLKCILEPHNYGARWVESGGTGTKTGIGSATVTNEHFVDLWSRIATFVKADSTLDPALYAYELINEPQWTASEGCRPSATMWDFSAQSSLAWSVEAGSTATVTLSTTAGDQFPGVRVNPWHPATTKVMKVSGDFSAAGFAMVRLNDGTARSAGDGAAGTWIYLPASAGGSGWRAIPYCYNTAFSTDGPGRVTLLRKGQWNFVSGQLSNLASDPRAFGLQLDCGGSAGTVDLLVSNIVRGTPSAMANVEAFTQQALTAIRAAGDNRPVLVPGGSYQNVHLWVGNHPYGWIFDPADNFRYSGHHYCDDQGSSDYTAGYAADLAASGGF